MEMSAEFAFVCKIVFSFLFVIGCSLLALIEGTGKK